MSRSADFFRPAAAVVCVELLRWGNPKRRGAFVNQPRYSMLSVVKNVGKLRVAVVFQFWNSERKSQRKVVESGGASIAWTALARYFSRRNSEALRPVSRFNWRVCSFLARTVIEGSVQPVLDQVRVPQPIPPITFAGGRARHANARNSTRRVSCAATCTFRSARTTRLRSRRIGPPPHRTLPCRCLKKSMARRRGPPFDFTTSTNARKHLEAFSQSRTYRRCGCFA